MAWPPLHLKQVAERVHAGTTESHTVRELLAWYGYERRGSFIVWVIKRDLGALKLRVEPDLEGAYIDGELTFSVATVAPPEPVWPQPQEEEVQAILITSNPEDPTQRIGRLPSANSAPLTVSPSASVSEAVTLMLLHDYSQLPVMQGERTLKGVVSWQSIGRKLALGHPSSTVQDCLDDAVVMESSVSLFSAISSIVERGFVLVKDAQNLICGIVTTTDLSLQFRQLAEPYLLLGEIEKHLRRLGDGKFSSLEIKQVKDPSDGERSVNDLSDLTFGEHIRLIENPSRWAALKLNIDRSTFIRHLNEVREIRNGVMHFDPDGIAPSELAKLRQFVRLLEALGA